MSLTERRAIFVYGATLLAAQAAGAPVIPVPWEERDEVFKTQFTRAINKQCGPSRSMSAEKAHENWMYEYEMMGWTYGEEYSKDNKAHPDMVPYDELGQLEKDKDEVFIATCEIARRWIYEQRG